MNSMQLVLELIILTMRVNNELKFGILDLACKIQ